MKFYTLTEVAELLSIPERRLRSVISAGKLPIHRITPRDPRISEQDLQDWLNSTKSPQPTAAALPLPPLTATKRKIKIRPN